MKPSGPVFSVFCIGTGHTDKESNNTLVKLYDLCEGQDGVANYKITGLTSILGQAFGRGMRGLADKVYQTIRNALVDWRGSAAAGARVNFAAHSRGAVLCHMVAEEMSRHTARRTIEITMALIDPVNMSGGHD